MALVLVVNDDVDMLKVYQAALEGMGHRAMPRIDLEPGPEVVIESGAEAVIVDLQAKADAESGLHAIEALRKHPRTRDVPVILSTGAVREAERLRGRLASLSVPVLIKPFQIETFEQLVAEVLPPPG